MTSDDVIASLRMHRPELERLGVRHAALFGSLARGEARVDSDIDIAVDLADGVATDMFAYARLRREVAALIHPTADIVDRASLKPHIRANVAADAIDAF